MTNSILTECISLFRTARASLLEAAAALYTVRQEEAWKGKYETFTEFVEDGCGIDRGQGSRILKVYEHYCINSSVEPAQLASINPEKLYQALSLPGSVESQISKAQTLTKSELRSERNEQEPHEFQAITVCKTCWKVAHD